ncbi:MAG TPA: hypothetical protein VFY39_10180 [Gammaproteobacteria bacterium]|nr:hypothetical protein [Gammaproteobacteria bacterium]
MPTALKNELILGALLFCFGVALLPFAIFWVGQVVIGPYADEHGIWGLFSAIWSGLGEGRIPAWIVVLSPYVAVQLFRAARRLWRG